VYWPCAVGSDRRGSCGENRRVDECPTLLRRRPRCRDTCGRRRTAEKSRGCPICFESIFSLFARAMNLLIQLVCSAQNRAALRRKTGKSVTDIACGRTAIPDTEGVRGDFARHPQTARVYGAASASGRSDKVKLLLIRSKRRAARSAWQYSKTCSFCNRF